MIESINDLIERGVITDEEYKRIEIREIELGMELDSSRSATATRRSSLR